MSVSVFAELFSLGLCKEFLATVPLLWRFWLEFTRNWRRTFVCHPCMPQPEVHHKFPWRARRAWHPRRSAGIRLVERGSFTMAMKKARVHATVASRCSALLLTGGMDPKWRLGHEGSKEELFIAKDFPPSSRSLDGLLVRSIQCITVSKLRAGSWKLFEGAVGAIDPLLASLAEFPDGGQVDSTTVAIDDEAAKRQSQRRDLLSCQPDPQRRT